VNSTDHPETTQNQSAVHSWWPSRILGPVPGLTELNLACWGLFLGFVVVPLLYPLWLHLRAGEGWSYLLPCDFIYFYAVGRIAHEYPLTRLYEYSLILKTTDQIFPLKGWIWGPSPYPPFVALFFSLYARLPFLPAYILWMATSVALYLGGIAAVIRDAFPRQPLKSSLVYCVALGFYPFFICDMKNGQISAVAIFAVGMAVALERDKRLFLSGLALAILCYKPTLLLLLLPMLLLTRRFRTLAGFLTGGAALFLFTTAIGSVEIWRIYFRHAFGFLHGFIEVQGQSTLQLWEYIDFHTFSYAVPGGRTTGGLAVIVCISLAAAVALAVLLSRSAKSAKPAQQFAWAATITWTLLLNFYVPVWDSILVTLAVILTLRALNDLGWHRAAEWIGLIAVLIFAVTWNLTVGDHHHGNQLMMALLFLLGSSQLLFLHRASQPLPEVPRPLSA
jgi:hypothetical protein